MYEPISKDDNYKFLFYRFPKVIIKEDYKDLSLDAKMLYVLLLDRAGLSKKNKWYDKEGHVYVYFSIKEICKVLGICKDKARKLLRELDVENGIGLIRRVRRGQGKCDKIYVMSFQKSDESDIKEAEEPLSEEPDISPLEDDDFAVSLYNNKNKEIIPTQSNHSYQDDDVRWLDERAAVRNRIKENIDYDYFVEAYRFEKTENRPYGSIEELDELIETMVEVICSGSDTIKIGKENIPHSVVKQRFLELDQFHIEYVLECIAKVTTKIINPKAYNSVVLYNAPITMNSSINAEFRRNNPELV